MRGKAAWVTCPRVTKKQLLASECEPSRSLVSPTPCFPLVVSGEECTEAPFLRGGSKDREPAEPIQRILAEVHSVPGTVLGSKNIAMDKTGAPYWRTERNTGGIQMRGIGTSQVVQWLRLHTSNAGAVGSIPGPGTTTCCEVWPKKKKRSTRKGRRNSQEQHRNSAWVSNHQDGNTSSWSPS